MAAGVQVGAYRLVQLIGEGGMGSVWLAEHTMLGRRAAVKLLHASFASRTDVVTRFFNEARAATQIADPGIVQIFDFGHAADGQAFIAMELLEGEALDHRLQRLGRLQVQEAVRITRQVASSLGAAHARHIVHRDLKPENIYLVRDPEVPGGERAKILDFGIAKLIGDQGNALKTQANAVMGTPVYMSPEQCRGSGGVDARSDVYSLGCVLFTLIAGTPPFAAEGPGELLVAHMTRPAPRVSTLAPHVPSNVDALIARCLDKDPAARFQNGADLAAALGTLLSSVSDSGLPPRVQPSDAVTAILPETTTLGGAASQTSGSVTSPRRSSRNGLIAAGAALVVIGGVTAVLALRGGDDPSRGEREATALASEPAAPASAPAPATSSAPATGHSPAETAPVETAAEAAAAGTTPPAASGGAPATITIAIETTPPGAQVFVGADKQPRGTTPFGLELARADGQVDVRLVRRGYVSQEHALERTASSKLVVVLEKEKRSGRPVKVEPTPSPRPVRPPTTGATDSDSDDTMNPFANKK
jgi:eukaryotic-like serine/threonine-protein kinase